MTTDQIVLELRALPGAPEGLRARVRALPEPRRRREWNLQALPVRRALLVAGPAMVAVAFGAAALHGLLSSGEAGGTRSTEPARVSHGGAVHVRSQAGGAGATTTVPAFDAVTPRQIPHALEKLAPRAIPPSGTRLNRYEAWLRVQVPRDRLSAATTKAMRLARSYGGFVTSADLNTPGRRGHASLVLRVPVTKVQDAVLHLERLGDVTAQHVRIEDLQRRFDVQQQQIVKLRTTIARLEQQLQSPSLSAEDRIRLQYELAQTKSTLATITHAHAKTQREGTLATISVAFSAKGAAAAAPAKRGRLGRTLGDAGGFLVAEVAWFLYALIVVAPIALAAVLAAYALRAARRSSDRRLLEST